MARTRRFSATPVRAAVLIGALLTGGCNVGPAYHRASVTTPSAYKELPAGDAAEAQNWKVARPQDALIRGNWWQAFNDPKLDALEEQVDRANQNVAAAFASFLQARALVREARSQYYPTLTASPSVSRGRQSSNTTIGGGTGGVATTTGSGGTTGATTTTGGGGTAAVATTRGASTYTDYSLPFDASWTLDLWGRVRNTVKGNVAAAQASAADLENVRLTAQAEVAVDYFELRSQDEMRRLLDSTVAAYQGSLAFNQAQFETGLASDEAVAQAQVQLQTAQAQATNLGIARAQYEHAIAMLVGQAASTFSIPVEPLIAAAPPIPPGMPSQLLERRPDVAANERLMAQANAQIGVAKAAYFPTVTLNGSAGFESSSLSNWLTWPSRFWSVGPSLTETLFDAGLRHATVQQYQAAYDQTVANYRETVLTAFQQVEDDLAALRILAEEIQQQDAAVASAQHYLSIATDRYKLGLDPYLNVITAQTTVLSNQQTAVTLRMQQLTDSIQLIEALGGGWTNSKIPSSNDISNQSPEHTAP